MRCVLPSAAQTPYLEQVAADVLGQKQCESKVGRPVMAYAASKGIAASLQYIRLHLTDHCWSRQHSKGDLAAKRCGSMKEVRYCLKL